MTGAALTTVTALLLAYALFGRKTLAWNLSAPMVAMGAGFIVFTVAGTAALDLGSVHVLAEVTLILVLFHDAATVRLNGLVRDYSVPLRLLAIGFPLAVLAAFGTAWALFPGLGLLGAGLLAAAITPTDAGLGAPTVLNPAVPVRVRRALNVESGLNDGLATPIVLLCLAGLSAAEGSSSDSSAFMIGVVPVALALALALVVGTGSAWLLDRSIRSNWSTPEGRQIAVLMIPLLVLGLAEVIGANSFIAAFVGGLAFGASSAAMQDDEQAESGFLEMTSDVFGFGVWLLGGGVVLLAIQIGFRWQWLVMAVLALTVLRVVPVWLALLGKGFRAQTILFFGWFGPRGLASLIFALLVVEELGESSPVVADVVGTLAVTVVLSVVAHGISAAPLSRRYGAWAHRVGAPIEQEPPPGPRRVRGGSIMSRVG